MIKFLVQRDDFSVGILFYESKVRVDEKFVNLQRSLKENVIGKLIRNVILLQGVLFIVGVMIGFGIFVILRYVFLYFGFVGMILIVWIVFGVMVIFGVLCYCELGILIQRFGGELIYIREVFGFLFGFFVSWIMVLILKLVLVVIIILSFVIYVIQLFLSNSYNEFEFFIKCIVVICIILITFVNCVSFYWVGQMQIVFMIMKLVVIGIIVFIGVFRIVVGKYENFAFFFKGINYNVGEIVYVFFSGLWVYDGWN